METTQALITEGKCLLFSSLTWHIKIRENEILELAANFKPEVSEAQRELDAVIEELDEKLDKQLKKQEH